MQVQAKMILRKRHKSDEKNHSILNETISINSILKSLKLEKYLEIFEKNEIDLVKFLSFGASDLRKLGVKDVSDRHKILQAVIELK